MAGIFLFSAPYCSDKTFLVSQDACIGRCWGSCCPLLKACSWKSWFIRIVASKIFSNKRQPRTEKDSKLKIIIGVTILKDIFWSLCDAGLVLTGFCCVVNDLPSWVYTVFLLHRMMSQSLSQCKTYQWPCELPQNIEICSFSCYLKCSRLKHCVSPAWMPVSCSSYFFFLLPVFFCLFVFYEKLLICISLQFSRFLFLLLFSGFLISGLFSL